MKSGTKVQQNRHGERNKMNILTLFISLRCTQACAHCVFGCSPEHGKHMSWDVFDQSLAIAKKTKIPKLNFFGGEPLLNPRFFPMLQTALNNKLDLILATNCRLLAKEEFFTEFIGITKQQKEHIVIITSRDRFHLQFFDPAETVKRLLSESYKVVVNNWSDYSVLLSEYNANNEELQKLDTNFACCNHNRIDYLGVLPDGGWQICPSYLEAFGDIFSDDLEEITEFRRGLPLRYDEGCTKCLKFFKGFHQEFEAYKATKKLRA